MKARELKDKFIHFFVSKNHQEIPSASLVPENDPTTLFISAGMHPLVPYLLGQKHPLGKRLVNVQKCVRTGDIEDVGDTYHHTFFEMLGNWSLGDYFKEEMIPWSYEFLTKELGVDPNHLHVTCFEGDVDAPRDEESAAIWKRMGLADKQIHFLPKEDNWWGPAGTQGPCGPDTEMFIDLKPELPHQEFKEACHQGRYIEIWNDVFMEYNKTATGTYETLSQKNVDTGMGVERTTAILSGLSDNYLSPIWQPIIIKIEEVSGKSYATPENQRPIRVIADHLRSAVFIIADGIEPSNKEAGYVLRRLIRRAIRQAKLLGVSTNFTMEIAKSVLDNQDNYAGTYPELDHFRDKILTALDGEENKFRRTLDNGLKEINRLISRHQTISGTDAFKIYESYGFPLEMIIEELSKNGQSLNVEEFNQAKLAHQEKSRTLSSGKFKSGLSDQSEVVTKYHTATHLLHASLRKILGKEVRQVGSNITRERLRFDFTYPEKLSRELLESIQKLVNEKINESLPVTCRNLPYRQAIDEGALAFFEGKYPENVSVYTIGEGDNIFSKEVCTGPHVANTKTLGSLEITKEESAGSGKRRIYATLK